MEKGKINPFVKMIRDIQRVLTLKVVRIEQDNVRMLLLRFIKIACSALIGISYFFIGIGSIVIYLVVNQIYASICGPYIQNMLCEYRIIKCEDQQVPEPNPSLTDINKAFGEYINVVNNIDQSITQIKATLYWATLNVNNKLNLKPTIKLSYNNNGRSACDKNDQNEATFIDKLIFYFQNGSLLFENSDNNIKEIEKFKGILRENQKDIDRIIYNITGYASREKVRKSNDRFSNNYELSLARSETIKRQLIATVGEFRLGANASNFFIFGQSNQSLTQHSSNDRRVEVAIYLQDSCPSN